MATGSRFLLRLDLVTVQPAVGLAMAMADSLAAFLRRVREMAFHRAVAAVSFAVRFSPETDLFAVVLFGLSRSPICFATAGFVPAADPSDPAGFGFVVVVVAAAAAAVVVVVVDPFDLSVADPSVVVAGPGFVGSAVFAADLASSACSVAV